jgi:Fe-S cluster assembly ATP-binding protein
MPESVLDIRDLRVAASGREILRGVTLTVRSGEVHAVMGPNGSGKSTLSYALAGRPGYEILSGSVTLDGVDLLALEPWQRAQAGLFLALQYPVEVPGVLLRDVLIESARARAGNGAGDAEVDDVLDRFDAEATRLGVETRLLDRALNVDLSGGERKRNETLQLAVLQPRIAILDEIDSGLDIDALRTVSRRVEAATNENALGVLAITHYSRLLRELKPDVVHILWRGRVVRSGGPELADQVEADGYAAFEVEAGDDGQPAAASGGPARTLEQELGLS